MKRIIYTMVFLCSCCFMQAQDVMIVKNADGSIISYNVSDIDEVFFGSRSICPDNHHPHAIDLGLPSGTKWCCCNVGASTPEGYGGYYAWGEIWEKSVYNLDNYTINNWTGIYENIGSNISGTRYDVAYVRMGAPWRMPSIEQLAELLEHCTQMWTQQNGVNGLLFIGPNGGQVFLPAAGHRWDGSLNYAGSHGFYWSSSLRPEDRYLYAYYLYFPLGSESWDNIIRGCGFSVRPVCP